MARKSGPDNPTLPPNADSPPTDNAPNPFNENTPDYFLWEIKQIDQTVHNGGDPLEAGRRATYWRERASELGYDLSQLAQEKMDPINRLLSSPNLTEYQEKELLAIKSAMDAADAMAENLSVKKKWIELIDLTLSLQERAKKSIVNFGIYVVRNQENNAVLQMEEIHLKILATWNDPEYPNSLVEAHPSVGKTTLLYIQDSWEIAHDQKLRFLKLCSDLKKSRDRLEVVRTYLLCRRFRALFPHVRIDPQKPNNQGEFTVIRPNIGSHDPTMFAAGATSEIQGGGFERIDCDDLCTEDVRWERSTREKITANFSGVAMRRRRSFGQSGARIRYICTPWHVEDTAGWILSHIRSGKFPDWREELFPVSEDENGNPIPSISRPGLAEDILATKHSDPITYACCYRLDPSNEKLRALKGLVYYDVSGGTDPLCPETRREYYKKLLAAIKNGERWKVVDPAAGGRCKTGIIDFALSVKGTAAIIGADFLSTQSTETAEYLVNAIVKDQTDKLLIEGGANFGKVTADWWGMYLTQRLGPEFRNRIEESGTRYRNLQGQEVGQNISKDWRFVRAAPLLENGVIMFPGKWGKNDKGEIVLKCVSDPNLVELHDQITKFPSLSRKDGIDCISLFVHRHSDSLVRNIPATRKPVSFTQQVAKQVGVLTALYQEQCKQEAQPPPCSRWEEMEMFSESELLCA